jgi:hypothetical protein
MSPIAGAGTVSSAVSGSIIYAGTARRMAAQSKALDDQALYGTEAEPDRNERATALLSVALSSVLSAYFSVEALLNELLLASRLGTLTNFPGLEPALGSQLSAAYDAGVERLSSIEKTDMALIVGQRQPLDWSAGVAQRFRLLHDLRNELVHHKPKWVVKGADPRRSDDKLERRLHTQFENALIWQGQGVAFRWTGCLGAGCAQWAHETAVGFAAEVLGRLDVRLPGLKV